MCCLSYHYSSRCLNIDSIPQIISQHNMCSLLLANMIAGKTMIVIVILTMTDAVQEEHSRGLAPTGVAVSHPQAQSVPSSVIAIVVGVVMDATVTVASQRMKTLMRRKLPPLLLLQQLPRQVRRKGKLHAQLRRRHVRLRGRLTSVPSLPNHNLDDEPTVTSKLDYEVELGIVIGTTVPRFTSVDDAHKYIGKVTLHNLLHHTSQQL